jgi:ATP-dependent DNA helicase HFM1/MER3
MLCGTVKSYTDQFTADKEGIAIIMCENELEEKYKALAQGRTILESCLHLNLVEHLNSEIGLGTISSFESAKTWLMRSFMFRRIQKNPEHYKTSLGENLGKHDVTWEERIGEMVMNAVKKLQSSGLIEQRDRNGSVCGKLVSTEYGDIMSKVKTLRNLDCNFQDADEE